MTHPTIHHSDSSEDDRLQIGANPAFEIHEWSGGGPGYLHVHDEDDEAWHIISGRLCFRFANGRTEEVGSGTTVYVPAGVAHDYDEIETPSRYLLILTPRLRALIDELHRTPFEGHQEIMRRYRSRIVE